MSNQSTLERQNCNDKGKRSKKMSKVGNNSREQLSKQDPTRNFVTWYKHMIDYERQNFCLYLCDTVVLDWFGRTVRTRKKVSAFLNYEVQQTKHDIKSIKKIEKLQSREERDRSPDSSDLAVPLSCDVQKSTCKRKLSISNSPEWDVSDSVNITFISNSRKRLKSKYTEPLEENIGISNNGDGTTTLAQKRKHTSVTPTNVECGQGDGIPSTSGTDSDISHDNVNTQLQKLAVECNGFVQFTRTRNNHCVDTMKWDRKCKVQISYSEDPLNVGEYIIWALCYNDESKCRRNLLSAFDEAAKEEE